jgi:hypothetical protein
LPDGGRTNQNTVILPTGALLVLGGVNKDANGRQFAYSPVLFENGNWSKLPANPEPSRRDYHSTAVLLPDGRIFIGGDDRDYDYEIFSPAYLDDPAARPQGLAWQAPVPFIDPDLDAYALQYGEGYTLDCNALPLGHTLTKAILTAPCSTTHHSDMHQRYVELNASVVNGTRVQFKLPASDKYAPRGLYMLWLVTNSGYVSNAIWVVLR